MASLCKNMRLDYVIDKNLNILHLFFFNERAWFSIEMISRQFKTVQKESTIFQKICKNVDFFIFLEMHLAACRFAWQGFFFLGNQSDFSTFDRSAILKIVILNSFLLKDVGKYIDGF